MAIRVNVHPRTPLQPPGVISGSPTILTILIFLRFLPAATPSVLVIGFLFVSGDGAGCVGGAPDGVLRGGYCAETKRSWTGCFIVAQTHLLTDRFLPQSRVQVSRDPAGP